MKGHKIIRKVFCFCCSALLSYTFVAPFFITQSTVYSQNIARRSKILTQTPSSVVTPAASSIFKPKYFEPDQNLEIALIALDKDSTLTVSRKPISKQSAERVADILQKGIKFLVITGSDAVNTFKCVVQPIRAILEERGKGLGAMQNLFIYSSVGSASFKFDANGEAEKTSEAPKLLTDSERYKVWQGIMRGFVEAVEEYRGELSDALQKTEHPRDVTDGDINTLSDNIDKAVEINDLNQALKYFISKYPELFGDANADLNKRLGIRDENVLNITSQEAKELGLRNIDDPKAPKITFEIAHVPPLGLSVMKNADFTRIIMEEVRNYVGGVRNVVFKNGPTYVDVGKLRTKEKVVREVMNKFVIGDGAIVLGGDSSNDIEMLTMNLDNRVVFRFYVGKHAQFNAYFQNVTNNKDQIIQSSTEDGPAEISYLFSSILDGLGKPMGEFRFLDNEHSYNALNSRDSVRLAEENFQKAKDIILPEAQSLLDFLDGKDDATKSGVIGAPDFSEDDVQNYKPIMLLVGSPSPQAFANAALQWKKYSDWWGFNVPVIASTGRGRGYKELVENTLKFFDDLEKSPNRSAQEESALSEFRRLIAPYSDDIQEIEKKDAGTLMEEYKEFYSALEGQLEGGILTEQEFEEELDKKLTEAKVIKFILMAYQVDEKVIVLEEKSSNTLANMTQSHKLILDVIKTNENFGLDKLKIHVVADGFHRLRALLTALTVFNLGGPKGMDYEQMAHSKWAINGQAPYVPDLRIDITDEDVLMEYLVHMIGNPNGEGRERYGEIERFVEFNSAVEAGFPDLQRKISDIWNAARRNKLRDILLKNYMDAKDIKDGG